MSTDNATSPRVTVICATYNYSSVLPYSIGSVIDQTYTDWEMLVVGDECTDDSEEVVEGIKRENNEDRVRWINLVPGTKNQYGPNNEGLRQARGEFIAYIGHDDLWLPHHLEVLVAAMDAGADVAYSTTYWPNEDGSALTNWAPDECYLPSSTMHRRALTDELGVWRDYRELVEGPFNDLRKRFKAKGARFDYVPRLSIIKIAAALRKDVYHTKTCQEQQHWLARIRQEPDLEPKLLVNVLKHTYASYWENHLARTNALGYRVAYHLKRLSRGQLPLVGRLRRAKPGDRIRDYNRTRNVHKE